METKTIAELIEYINSGTLTEHDTALSELLYRLTNSGIEIPHKPPPA